MEQPERGQPLPVYFLGTFGLLGLASLLLPVLMWAYPFLPDVSARTLVMAEIICVMIFAYCYMYKQAIWEGELRRSVRGAQGQSVKMLATLALLWAMGVGFFAAVDGTSYLRALLPTLLEKLTVPPLQISILAGITGFFSIMAALEHMSKLERAGLYRRPPYLRPEIDLPDLAIERLKENLRIPAGEAWKIIERVRTPSGGIQFTLFWTEKVKRIKPDGESVEFTQEKRYVVELDVRGSIVSVKEKS